MEFRYVSSSHDIEVYAPCWSIKQAIGLFNLFSTLSDGLRIKLKDLPFLLPKGVSKYLGRIDIPLLTSINISKNLTCGNNNSFLFKPRLHDVVFYIKYSALKKEFHYVFRFLMTSLVT